MVALSKTFQRSRPTQKRKPYLKKKLKIHRLLSESWKTTRIIVHVVLRTLVIKLILYFTKKPLDIIISVRFILWSRRPLFSCVPLWIGCRNRTCAWPEDRTNVEIRDSWAGSSSCCSQLSFQWLISRRKSDSAPLHVSDSYPLRRHYSSLPIKYYKTYFHLLIIYVVNLVQTKILLRRMMIKTWNKSD